MIETAKIKLSDEQLTGIMEEQFKYSDKTFIEAALDNRWRETNTVSQEQHTEWLEWLVEYLMNDKKLDERTAQIEASWIDLKWGLKVND